MKKKILAVLLACALAAGTAAGPAGVVTVLAEEGQANVTEDGIRYRDIGDGIEITGYDGSATEVMIPNTISGKTVTRIGWTAFSGCYGLTGVSIPEGVTSIGGFAFNGCSGLTGVSIPGSVISIGERAFYECSGLTSVNIPEGVTRIGEGAFEECGGLTSVSISESVTIIGDSAFAYCGSLTSMDIPESVTDIGKSAFRNTPWLSEQLGQDGGLAIVNHIVIGAAGDLTSVNIPDGVTSIGDDVFSECSSLTSVNIPDGVTSIGDSAFYRCSSLTSVSIPESVTYIGGNAFDSTPWLIEQLEQDGGLAVVNHIVIGADSSLTSVDIPDGVTSIGAAAFLQCSLTSVNIPESVTSIGRSAFSSCRKLTGVSIPEGMTKIGKYAFSDCINLTSVNIPESVTGIEWQAFINTPWQMEQCRKNGGLLIVNHVVTDASVGTNASIPEGVTGIGELAFSMCPGLESVSIPESVTSIGEKAFAYLDGLKDVYYAGSRDQWKKITIGNENESLLAAAIHCNTSGPAVSGPDVTEDGFYYRDTGSGIVITNYAGRAKEVSIPEKINGKTVTGIGDGAFMFHNSLTVKGALTSVNIPKGVTSIGASAFAYCSELTSVSMPEGVMAIGDNAFEGCGSLKDARYAGSGEQWKKIKIGNGNEPLLAAAIRYGSSGSDKETSKKADQSVNATDITKTYGVKPFSLGAKSSAGGALSYEVSDPKVATVDKSGKVTIKGCGIVNITITAAETSTHKTAQKTIKLTVKPKKMTLSSVKSKKKKTAVVKWKKDQKASGYVVECATDGKFKKNKVTVTVGKNKTVSATVKKLKAGKKYYVRVCAYVKSGKTKLQGDWSKAKTVRVKK